MKLLMALFFAACMTLLSNSAAMEQSEEENDEYEEIKLDDKPDEHRLTGEQISILLSQRIQCTTRDSFGFPEFTKNPLTIEQISERVCKRRCEAEQENLDVEKESKNSTYHLFRGVWNGDCELVEKVIQLGVSVDALNSSGQTALIIAVLRNHMDMVELLFDYKPKINIQDTLLGNTALHYAATIANLKIVTLLLKKGAHPTLTNSDNKKPADLSNEGKIQELLRKYEARNNGERGCIIN